jgi:hypothetical protein
MEETDKLFLQHEGSPNGAFTTVSIFINSTATSAKIECNTFTNEEREGKS